MKEHFWLTSTFLSGAALSLLCAPDWTFGRWQMFRRCLISLLKEPFSCFSISETRSDGKLVHPQHYRSWAICAAFITRCLAPCHFPSPLLLIEINTSYGATGPNYMALIRALLSAFYFHNGLGYYLIVFFFLFQFSCSLYTALLCRIEYAGQIPQIHGNRLCTQISSWLHLKQSYCRVTFSEWYISFRNGH